MHDRDDVGDVLIPSVQRRVGAPRCSVPSNIRQHNAIPISEPVGEWPHAVVIRPATVQHDDQLAAADDLAHERPTVIADVQRAHHTTDPSSLGEARQASTRHQRPRTLTLEAYPQGYTLVYTYPVGYMDESRMGER